MLPSAGRTLPPFRDVNGDGWLTPKDVLMVINYLNALPPVPPAGEGEAVPAAWSHTRVLARPSLGSDGQPVANAPMAPRHDALSSVFTGGDNNRAIRFHSIATIRGERHDSAGGGSSPYHHREP